MKKSMWWVTAALLLVTAFGALLFRRYQLYAGDAIAEATLEVHAVSPDFETLSVHSIPLHGDVFGRNIPGVYVKIDSLTTESTLRALVESESVRATDWYAQFEGDRDAAMASLLDGTLTADNVSGSSQIHLRVVTAKRGDALIILRQWIDIERDLSDRRIDAYYFDTYRLFLSEHDDVLEQIEELEARTRSHQAEPSGESSSDYQANLNELDRLRNLRDSTEEAINGFDTLLLRSHFRLEVQSEPAIVRP